MSAAPLTAGGPALVRDDFGALPDGRPVARFTLDAGGAVAVSILAYGGIVQRLLAPDRDGERANVVLGLPRLEDYVERNGPHFGALVGRVANRIPDAELVLDGVRRRLDANDGPHCLHGGPLGFSTRLWHVSGGRRGRDRVSLALRLASPDGEGGFPGALVVEATYTLCRDDTLRLDLRATTDRPTILSPTSHVYWQLAGEGTGSIDDHVLTVNASRYLPVAPDLVPAGEPAPVAGTPLDFRAPAVLGPRLRQPHEQLVRARGLDHHFLLDEPGPFRPAARLDHPASGRRLELTTTEPGLQVYAGNHLDGSLAGTGGRLYRQGDGLALEPQHCPGAVDRPGCPSVVLRPGRVFASTTVFGLTTVAEDAA